MCINIILLTMVFELHIEVKSTLIIIRLAKYVHFNLWKIEKAFVNALRKSYVCGKFIQSSLQVLNLNDNQWLKVINKHKEQKLSKFDQIVLHHSTTFYYYLYNLKNHKITYINYLYYAHYVVSVVFHLQSDFWVQT